MKADKADVTRLLKTAKGQINGILKMIEEDRYCIDISNQIQAANAVLRKANKEILRAHLRGCVKESFETGEEEIKIDELIEIIDKVIS